MLGRDRATGTTVRDETQREPRDTEGEGSVLACASCEKPVTNAAARIEVRGSHEHRFVNPEGDRFHIGCFSRAYGCVTMGAPTLEFTWFPGYTWQFETCGACGGPLGWLYQSSDHLFHGLILDCLIELT